MARSTTEKIHHQDYTRIILRPIASGMPVGFFSFAIGMLLLACYSLGIIPLPETKQLGEILVSFVFPIELLATIFAFLARDSMSAATLGLFTTSWLVLGVFYITQKAGSTSIALGIYLFGFAAAIYLLGVMAIPAKPFFTVLLILAGTRTVLAGVYEVGGAHSWLTISGYFALAVMLMAFYGGVAFALEDAKQKPVLPLFRRGTAEAAFSGYKNQLDRLEAEPGVRQQL
jgi:succinate-acetate transporter protein